MSRGFAMLDIEDAPEDRLLLAYGIGSAQTEEYDIQITASGKTIEIQFKSRKGKENRRYWVDITDLVSKAAEIYRGDIGATALNIEGGMNE